MRFAEGEPSRLPLEVRLHLVAIRYGQSPAEVRAWPAADFLEAAALWPYTGSRR